MKIIELTQTQFKNYSIIHSQRNFGQTVEFSLMNNNSFKLFLGLIDDNNNIHAAALILINKIKNQGIKAIAPDGFLIDYTNYELLKEFTSELIQYLNKKKVTFLITDPMFKYKIYDNKYNLIKNNQYILNNLISLNYKDIGYQNEFEKYDIIIENSISSSDIYKHFNRNTQKHIREGINYGITLHKGKKEDIEKAYDIFKKKTPYNISYYKSILSSFDTEDNKMEIFFAKLNPKAYLINSKKLYEKELINNEKIHKKCSQNIGKIAEKLFNKKMNSDNRLKKLHENLKKAIDINNIYQKDLIIGTSLIIRNNREIYFLIDGFKDDYRSIHSTHILKWAIIKKYFKLGYRIFNLGEIHKDFNNIDNKYHNQYLDKIGFGGNIIEYPPNLLLVINKKRYIYYSRIKNNKILKHLIK